MCFLRNFGTWRKGRRGVCVFLRRNGGRRWLNAFGAAAPTACPPARSIHTTHRKVEWHTLAGDARPPSPFRTPLYIPAYLCLYICLGRRDILSNERPLPAAKNLSPPRSFSAGASINVGVGVVGRNAAGIGANCFFFRLGIF